MEEAELLPPQGLRGGISGIKGRDRQAMGLSDVLTARQQPFNIAEVAYMGTCGRKTPSAR